MISAKEKMDATKMTGGGGKTNFNQCEDLIVQHWIKRGSAEATGVDGGLESVVNAGIYKENIFDIYTHSSNCFHHV